MNRVSTLLFLKRLRFFFSHVITSYCRLRNLLFFLCGRIVRKNKLSLSYSPYRLDVEPTTHCNFRCTMCHVSSPEWQGKKMSLQDFELLVDQNPQVFKIKLQGMGEPFVNKKFLEMAEYASKRGIYVTTTTNGSVLTEHIVDRIVSLNCLSEIIVSLDGATKSTFESIRAGSNFDLVLSGVSRLIKENSKLGVFGRAFVSAWMVIQNDNIDEAREIVALAASLGFDRLTIQITLSDWGKSEWGINKEKQIGKEDFRLRELDAYAKSLGLWLEIYEDNLLSPGQACSWPFTSMYIGANLDVVPCCSIADPSVVSFGSIRNKDLIKIWNSEEYMSLRRTHKNGTPPDYCKQCYRGAFNVPEF